MRGKLCLALMILATSCAPRSKSVTPLPEYEAKGSWEEVRSSLEQLPDSLKGVLGDDFFAFFDGYAEDPLFRVKLAESPELLPLFPGYPMTLQSKSLYDGERLYFTVRAPLTEDSERVTIFLGDKEHYSQLLEHRGQPGWLIHIPSRRNFNYLLVAEGDFWHTLEKLQELYPQLKGRPLNLVGVEEAADAALLFANHQRHRFAGVAISGGSLGLELPNLDHLPLVTFGNEPEKKPWSGHRLPGTLQARGNVQALSHAKTLLHALEFLNTQSPPLFAPYTFNDAYNGTAWPGVKVLTRRSETEPVTLSAHLENETLVIDAPNVTSLQIDRDLLPEAVSQVKLNNETSILPTRRSLSQVGEENLPEEWKKKGETPSTLINFFRSEPLVVVYQDNAGKSFSLTARNSAEQISRLSLRGLPANSEVRLPVLSLSEYLSRKLPPHRMILVATTQKAKEVLQKNEDGYLPLEPEDETFSLVYPPEELDSCRLAWTLAAPTTEELQRLTQRALSITTLYGSADLHLYPNGENESLRTFDSYWGNVNSKSYSLALPPQTRETWEIYLEDLILTETATPALLLSPLTEPHAEVPSSLSRIALKRFIPDRHFAVVTLRASASARVANKLLSATSDATVNGVDNFLTDGHFDPQKLRKRRKQLLVETTALATLSQEDLGTIHYEIFPYSLHEMLQNKITADAQEFGRELIRLSQTLNFSQGVVR